MGIAVSCTVIGIHAVDQDTQTTLALRRLLWGLLYAAKLCNIIVVVVVVVVVAFSSHASIWGEGLMNHSTSALFFCLFVSERGDQLTCNNATPGHSLG